MPSTSNAFAVRWQDDSNVLPNGRYVICYSGQCHDYIVYTVQSGTLKDQRIVKYRNSLGVYRGFANVMSDGTIRIWRSQREFAGSDWMNLFTAFVSSTDENINSLYRRGVLNTYLLGADATIDFANRCNRCNAHVVSYTGASWCADHQFCIDELRQEIEYEERAQRYESRRSRQVAAARANLINNNTPLREVSYSDSAVLNPLSRNATSTRRMVRAGSASQVPSTVLLSENGTGLIR